MARSPNKPRTPQQRLSPLYTSPAAKVAKAQVIHDQGKDSDGAYRTRNRKDQSE